MPSGRRHFTPGFRDSVRDAFCSGEFATIRDLATSFEITTTTVNRWRKKYRWDERAEEVRKAAEPTVEDLAKRVRENNATIYTLWQSILGQVAKRLKGTEKLAMGMAPDDLDKTARILERAQRGQRIALGSDRFDEEGGDRKVVVEYEGLVATIQGRGVQLDPVEVEQSLREAEGVGNEPEVEDDEG